MNSNPDMRKARTSAADKTPKPRWDRKGIAIDPAAYQPLKELSDSTGIPMRDLLSEAIALLLLEHSEPVPPALRRKLRVNIPGLDR